MTIVKGLGADGYLIGNPIMIEISDDSNPIVFVEILIVNLTTGKPSAVLKSYARINNKVLIDIAPTIKSVFSAEFYKINDSMSSMNKMQVHIRPTHVDNDTSELILTKHFIRGWRSDKQLTGFENPTVQLDLTTQNKTLNTNQYLKVTDRVPRWEGFTNYPFWIDANYNITDLIPATAPDIDFWDDIRPKGCNHFYVQFLNSVGGYSYYLFESLIDNYSNSPFPKANNSFTKIDLGSDFQREYNVRAKVKVQHINLIRDLIYSPFIYRVNEKNVSGITMRNEIRLRCLSNSISVNRNEKTVEVNLKFEDFAIVNPSLL